MNDLSFSQSARPNYAAPILIAIVVFGSAAGLIYWKMAQRTIRATVTRTLAYPVKTVYRSAVQSGAFKVLDKEEGESDLYLIPTLHIENHLDVPLFLKDFTLTFDTADGEMHTSAIEKNDLDAVYVAFPAIQPLATPSLLRETTIAPGATIEGTLLAQFPVPKSTWEARKSATVTIDFYHAPSITVSVPTP